MSNTTLAEFEAIFDHGADGIRASGCDPEQLLAAVGNEIDLWRFWCIEKQRKCLKKRS